MVVGATPQVLPRKSYTGWIRRVLAAVVDGLPVFVVTVIGWGVLLGDRDKACLPDPSPYDIAPLCSSGATTAGQLAVPISALIALAFLLWNIGYRQGRTGRSIGKSLLGFVVLSEKTWQPVGFGRSVVRQLAHIVDAIPCWVGFLFPLWDSKRQTLADKMMSTVCVPDR